MNNKIKRFLEVTIPTIILQGAVVTTLTYHFGVWGGVLPIATLSVIDVVFTKN